MTDTGDDFDTVYRELFPRVAHIAFRLLGNRTAAEDVAAETLARAYAHWSRIGSAPYRDGWVLRVGTNLAIDTARRRPPRPEMVTYLDDAEAATLRLALVSALRTLPRRQRQAIVLRYLSGLRDEELPRALGVSAGTASTHLRRGLDALRRRLGDDFREETLTL